MPVIHGGGSVELNFNHVASRPIDGTVEPKVCEWCTRQFFRSAFPPMRLREKLCADCRKRRNVVAERE